MKKNTGKERVAPQSSFQRQNINGNRDKLTQRQRDSETDGANNLLETWWTAWCIQMATKSRATANAQAGEGRSGTLTGVFTWCVCVGGWLSLRQWFYSKHKQSDPAGSSHSSSWRPTLAWFNSIITTKGRKIQVLQYLSANTGPILRDLVGPSHCPTPVPVLIMTRNATLHTQ